MDQQRWKKINNIVDAALELDKEKRETFIKQKCRYDEQLKEQVAELLHSIEKSETEHFLDEPNDLIQNLTHDISGEKKAPESALIGTTIDNYKILELIEHGGMGSVFIAKRTDEAYQKKVALKLLRRGMDTPENIARFKRERNILASLDHPNITSLLDGGVTRDGLPYLVMDLVDGTPLYEYCDSHRLSLDGRLEIFKTICNAVQQAHKNAIIHRDLKPSNILITGEGKVKVLDFGIAKLAEKDQSKTTSIQTHAGARILTLRYAAPEQVSAQAITTATDIYALGILLYELLAGTYPFELKDKNFREIERVIQEAFPQKPSSAFKNLSEIKQNEIAENRSSSPSTLVKNLTDELDAIVLKAIRKKPKARYSSVEELLDDLAKRESNIPIEAKSDTIRYKTSKFLQRRKSEISVAFLVLVMASGLIAYHTKQITRERNIARQEARKANEVSAFLLELFDTESTEDTLNAAGLLQKGMAHLEELENETAHANMISVMGQAYMNFGDYEKAEDLLQKAIEENRQVYGEESIEYATALFKTGVLYEHQYEWEEAVSNFQRSYELYSELMGADQIQTANILSHLGISFRNIGELEEAERYARKAVDIHNQILEPTDSQLLTSLANLAYVLRERGEASEAESIYLKIIERGKSNPSVNQKVLADYYNNLGYLYRDREEYAKAVGNYQHALALQKQNYVEGHPEIINTRRNLASSLYFQERREEAESVFKDNVFAIREKYGTNHWRTASALNVVGLFYLKNQQFSKAESYLRESTQVNRQVLGEDHLWTAYSEGLLAASLKLQNKNGLTADSLYQHHFNLYKNKQSDLDRNNRNHLNRLIEVYDEHQNHDTIVMAYRDLL